MRSASRRFRVSLCTVQRWVARAKGKRPDRTDLADRAAGCGVSSRRTPSATEDLVLAARADLKANSDLGEYGAAAVRDRLAGDGVDGDDVPSVRTINRIFRRRGVLDASRRVRRPAPPRRPAGTCRTWPNAASSWTASTSSRDWSSAAPTPRRRRSTWRSSTPSASTAGSSGPGPRALSPRSSRRSASSNTGARSACRGTPSSTTTRSPRARTSGPTRSGASPGCAWGWLGVVPVFAPPRETGFQAAVENFNGRWQAKVWARFTHDGLASVTRRSDRFVAAARLRSAPRIESAPPRRPFPKDWKPARALHEPLAGRVVFLRRSD